MNCPTAFVLCAYLEGFSCPLWQTLTQAATQQSEVRRPGVNGSLDKEAGALVEPQHLGDNHHSGVPPNFTINWLEARNLGEGLPSSW